MAETKPNNYPQPGDSGNTLGIVVNQTSPDLFTYLDSVPNTPDAIEKESQKLAKERKEAEKALEEAKLAVKTGEKIDLKPLYERLTQIKDAQWGLYEKARDAGIAGDVPALRELTSDEFGKVGSTVGMAVAAALGSLWGGRFLPPKGGAQKLPQKTPEPKPPQKTPPKPKPDEEGAHIKGKVPPKRRPSRRCELVPYKELQCDAGQEAHHVVPDWMLRTGKRGGPERIPGMPSLDEGPAICLEKGSGGEHNAAHKSTDPLAQRVGKSGKATGTPGTITLGQGKAISSRAIEKATKGGCSRADIMKQLNEQFKAHNDAILRAVKDSRKVTDEMKNILNPKAPEGDI